MARKVKVKVEFIFETQGDNNDKIIRCINDQIVTDLNEYWQNDDETAQMTEIKIQSFEFSKR